MATDWPGLQEWDSSHPNSFTMNAGTTNEANDVNLRTQLVRSAQGALHKKLYKKEGEGKPELANIETV